MPTSRLRTLSSKKQSWFKHPGIVWFLPAANPMTTVSSMAQPATVALFISDLHLSQSQPRTTQAFFAFLQQHASRTRELYILGDLFEYWAGDDDLGDPYNESVADALRMQSETGVKIFWIAGNRDFLIGTTFAHAANLTLLPDPFIASVGDHRITLAHGDAQCTDDTAYMAFRRQVRQPQWQATFLSLPLSQRKTIIADLRNDSRQAKSTKSYDIMDVNLLAIDGLFDATGTSIMIHGHTHRPACHKSSDGGGQRVRYVLPDWNLDTNIPRGGWIAIDNNGAIRHYNISGDEMR